MYTLDVGAFTWNMPITAAGPTHPLHIAQISKVWDGAGRFLFTDADSYRVAFAQGLDADARGLVLASALFVDLVYYERRAGR